MSCDPTWEVCDQIAADKQANADGADAGAAPADGKPKQGGGKAAMVAFLFAQMMWASMLANAFAVGSGNLYVSYQQEKAAKSSGTDTSTIVASSTYKATKYLGFLLTPYGFIGWVLFLLNTFVDGKGGPIQQSAGLYVKASPIVAMTAIGLGLWRSISRKKCADDATQWQCTLDNNEANKQDENKYKNSGYAQRSRQTFIMGAQMLILSKYTFNIMNNGLAEVIAQNQKESDDSATDADTDSADASADASTDADSSASSDSAWTI